jgi:hypothetical protein
MHSETKRRSAPTSSKSSSCGCSPREELCCQLDCLTQPHFFGGQLLADTDLTQLLTWSKDKFRLSRFRHGWGVVCGLDVQCDPGSQAVRVTPGYALDCCGHDILVCEDAAIPLDEACASHPDPCAMPEKSIPGRGAKAGETINFFGCPIQKSELREKILTIRYTEIPSDFETALGYAASEGTANCQPSRTRESFTLAWVDPLAQQVAAHQSLKDEYDACREVLQKYGAWHERRKSEWSDERPQQRWEDIRTWLLKWIDGTGGHDAHPLHQFCWLRDCLCTVDEMNPESLDQYVSNILFWLVQDCRNHTLQSGCRDCPDDHGVPLARVYLWVPRREQCKVLAIDPYPPYRRSLGLDSWPAPSGLVNIGQALWQPPEQASDLLMKMGLTVVSQETPFEIASDPYELYKNLECGLFVSPNERVSLQVVDTRNPLGKRVVGVCSAPAAADTPGTLEQALARAVAAASTARMHADELAKNLRERGTQDKWGAEALASAEAAASAAQAMEDLAKKIRERGTRLKEEETLLLARAAAEVAGETEDLTRKLRERGTREKWEEEALASADAAVKAARVVEDLAKKLRERATRVAKPSR